MRSGNKPGVWEALTGNGEGRCPADAQGLRLLFPAGPQGRGDDALTPAWEASNPSVSLKENTENSSLGKATLGGGRIVQFLHKSFVLNPGAGLQLE